MASVRGARLFCKVGTSFNLGRVQQQRRFVSLGLTALVQCNTKFKKRFQDVTVLPVNKFDLTGLGVITTTPALFSTQSFEALTDEASAEVVEEDGAAGMERKWPSPITQVTRSHSMVFVGGYGIDMNELSSVVSQFGEVKSINFPVQSASKGENDNAGSYKYAFVDFASEASKLLALQAGTITTPSGATVEIKDRTKSPRIEENRMTFIVQNLPNDVTVDNVYDHFTSFGNIRLINLVLNSPHISADADPSVKVQNFAFIMFTDDSDVQTLSNVDHKLGGQLINVRKVSDNTRRQRKDRSKKVILEGLHQDLDEEKVQSFFDGLGVNSGVYFLKDKFTSVKNGLAMLQFSEEDAAVKVAQDQPYDIDGCHVRVRRLGLLKDFN